MPAATTLKVARCGLGTLRDCGWLRITGSPEAGATVKRTVVLWSWAPEARAMLPT